MAVHRIQMSEPRHEVENADIDFWVWADGEQLGHLHISKGTVDWFRGKSSVNKYTLTWEDFAAFMRDRGTEKRTVVPKRMRKNVVR